MILRIATQAASQRVREREGSGETLSIESHERRKQVSCLTCRSCAGSRYEDRREKKEPPCPRSIPWPECGGGKKRRPGASWRPRVDYRKMPKRREIAGERKGRRMLVYRLTRAVGGEGQSPHAALYFLGRGNREGGGGKEGERSFKLLFDMGEGGSKIYLQYREVRSGKEEGKGIAIGRRETEESILCTNTGSMGREKKSTLLLYIEKK